MALTTLYVPDVFEFAVLLLTFRDVWVRLIIMFVRVLRVL